MGSGGKIEDSYFQGTVISNAIDSTNPNCKASGLVGELGASATNWILINRSYSVAELKCLGGGIGYMKNAGGIIRYKGSYINVSNSFTASHINLSNNASDFTNHGSVFGYAAGALPTSFAKNIYFDINKSGIEQCRQIVSGNGNVTSCFGVNKNNNQQDYFYNKSSAPLNTWDFTNIWMEVDGSYPVLREFFREEPNLNYTYQENADEMSWSDAGFLYINYTKPADFVSAEWQVKHGLLSEYNISIPADCADADGGKLILGFSSNTNNGLGQSISQPYCYNGTAWKEIGSASISEWITMFEPIYCKDIPKNSGEDSSDGNWNSFSERGVVYCVTNDVIYTTVEIGVIFNENEIPGYYSDKAIGARVYEEGISWAVNGSVGGKGMALKNNLAKSESANININSMQKKAKNKE